MRNFALGFIVAALIFSAAPVYGAVISYIGEEIDSEYTVIVDGVELEQKAISVNGTSFTPNRALADAAGYDVTFQEGKVIFTKKEGEQDLTQAAQESTPSSSFVRDLTLEESNKLNELVKLQSERNQVMRKIEKLNKSTKIIQEELIPRQKLLLEEASLDWVKERQQQEINKLEEEYGRQVQELQDLQERLTQINTKIQQLEEETQEYRIGTP